MTTYLYKPGHPHANARGFVDVNTYYQYKYMTEPDLRMMNGNEPVSVSYIPDEMPPTRHMGRKPIDVTRDGKAIHHMYTSKKKFRDETRARGCVEIGNEKMTGERKHIELDRRQRRDDMRRAIWECKNGESQALYELRNGSKADRD